MWYFEKKYIIISLLYTALILAAENGHLEIVKLLLQDNRVDPSVDNNYGISMKYK